MPRCKSQHKGLRAVLTRSGVAKQARTEGQAENGRLRRRPRTSEAHPQGNTAPTLSAAWQKHMTDKGTTSCKPLIESDRVEGTTVYDPARWRPVCNIHC